MDSESDSVGAGDQPFARQFFGAKEVFSTIGAGAIGGKAEGLKKIKDILETHFGQDALPGISVSIPRMTVITTDIFETFLKINDLHDIAYSDTRDDALARAFLRADLPTELLGDLRSIVEEVRSPLAIRSSSLLEDALREPFAGVYATKMIPNNQLSADERFRTLVEAIKFVYASTFFQDAKSYLRATGRPVTDERMAVIIQEVVGHRYGDRYYPQVSGVARSFNFYCTGHARPENGVVSLALGLGKTIVDGGVVWTYSPAYPKVNPLHSSASELLEITQNTFWAVNMGKPPSYDPIREAEYLCRGDLGQAEEDGTLRFIASTYDGQGDRIVPGTGPDGPRILTFAPLLHFGEIPLNQCLGRLLELCQDAYRSPVEIEFAVALDPERGRPARLGFLQVRPMLVSDAVIDVKVAELTEQQVLVASGRVLGNGVEETLMDVVYVKPDTFVAKETRQMVRELDEINRSLQNDGRPYMLIVFGRLGSQDPWLGIPVAWGQVAGAKVIVEATLPQMNVDMSQGSHFFHNLASFQVLYFSMDRTAAYPIRWEWFDRQEVVRETPFVRHVRLDAPLAVKVDGRTGRGLIRA